MRARHIALVALALGLTVAAFIGARALTARDARSDSEHRAEVAAAQIRGRLEQAASLTESLQRYMLDAGGTGVTSDQFARNALRWLSPANFPAAAWAEQVPAADRTEYERRTGQPIVTPDERSGRASPSSSYLPATLVSGFTPLDLRGVDLRREPGIAAAVLRASRPGGVAATPVTGGRARASGLFLVAPAPNLIDGVLRTGAVVVFVPEATLRASAGAPPSLRLVSAGRSSGAAAGGNTVRKGFFVGGRGFAVVMPKQPVSGPSAALPWIVLAGGLVLSTLAAGLGVNAGRRAKAQAEIDRIFNLSSDIIAVADFEGHFTRVNPAVKQILGYSREEFLSKPYLELVHPDDRERTAAEAAEIARGRQTLSFENRYRHKDGSYRVLEWTSTPVRKDGLMYGVARDITARRRAEAEREALANEQAALRRVATLVASGGTPNEIFAAVGDEVRQLVGNDLTSMFRCEPGDMLTLVAVRARAEPVPDGLVGARIPMRAQFAKWLVAGRLVRLDERATAEWIVDLPAAEPLELKSAIGAPIVVGGRPWGAIFACDTKTDGLPQEAERPFTQFTELVATAIANAEAGERLRQLAEGQAALRRVAVLVAEDVPSGELFSAVAREVGTLLGADFAAMARFEGGGVFTVATWAAEGEHPPVPERWEMQEGDPATTIARTRRATRWTDWSDIPGPIAEFIRQIGIRCTVGTPIVVEGRLWGALAIHSKQRVPLPPETEARMAEFTDLVGTAIANAEARSEARLLTDEQAALRRVATLVAREASQADTFNAIAEELAGLLGAQEMRMMRYEGDSEAVILASSGRMSAFRVGEHLPLDGHSTASIVFRTSSPARIDDYENVPGPMAEVVRSVGLRSVVGAPINVEGRLWGAMVAGTYEEPLPPDTELRLSQFTELMATAIGNTEARAEAQRLTEVQSSLRRVATLVASETPPPELVTKVVEEVANVLGGVDCSLWRDEHDGTATMVSVWGERLSAAVQVGNRMPTDGNGVIATVLREGRPYRIAADTPTSGTIAEHGRGLGISAAVGCPVLVGGQIWGALGAARYDADTFPVEAETHIAQFAELVATAVANADARAEVERLAEEQAALRRVATVVASGTPEQVFAKVAEEVGPLVGAEGGSIDRYDSDGECTVLGSWGTHRSAFPVGSRWRLDGESASALVHRTGRPVRLESYEHGSSAIAAEARKLGLRSAVGSPIVVNGRLWGALVAGTTQVEAFPANAESRVAQFADLVATAIANADARAEVERFAQNEGALRRIATLAAEGAAPRAVLDAVAAEMQSLLDADQVALNRFEPGDEILVLAHRGLDVKRTPVGSRVSIEGESVTAMVRRTGKPARMENYEGARGALAELARETGLRSSVSAPIVVGGELWGLITASWKGEESAPAGTEDRMAQFAQLLDTAIANTEARAEVERLADEQAALRRVATLVARGAAPGAVLDAVAAEMVRVLGSDGVTLSRYEPDEEVTVLAHRGSDPRTVPPGTRVSHRGENVTSLVRRTNRAARLEHYVGTEGAIAEFVRELGVRASVGAPIVVDGRLWGVAIANWRGAESPPADTEERMAQFAELLDTAIANADSRDQLAASRARLVTEGDEARRRVVRDLHDGAQQRLVHTIVTLKLARRALQGEDGNVESLVDEALAHAEQGNAELRELAHGILPSVLTHGGLRAGVDTVVERLNLPVEVDIPERRLPAEIEASAYFIVAEALTNIVKHSHAESAEVRASVEDEMLHLEVRDDGMGGADPDGHGLVGLRDRVTALGGRLDIESPPGGGTLLAARLPLGHELSERPAPPPAAAP